VVAISALLDPEAILFGGGTSNAGEALLERVREQAFPNIARPPRLILAGLRNESQLYGALWGAASLSAEPRRRWKTGKRPEKPLTLTRSSAWS
jgi:predicted NBD/HSP70 family sugar kinase